LVYTGALRTPTEAIAATVPVRGLATGVSAEGFALAGDVHLWRGELAPEDYSVPTPDGRPATRVFAGERLARVVCADRELLDDEGVNAIADALWDAQATRMRDAVVRVRARCPGLATAVVTGLGAFLAAEASGRAAAWSWSRVADRSPRRCARCSSARRSVRMRRTGWPFWGWINTRTPSLRASTMPPSSTLRPA